MCVYFKDYRKTIDIKHPRCDTLPSNYAYTSCYVCLQTLGQLIYSNDSCKQIPTRSHREVTASGIWHSLWLNWMVLTERGHDHRRGLLHPLLRPVCPGEFSRFSDSERLVFSAENIPIKSDDVSTMPFCISPTSHLNSQKSQPCHFIDCSFLLHNVF